MHALIRTETDVFRLNFSHGSHDEHAETYRRVRAAVELENSATAILADLCGPKIRTGLFTRGGIHLERGSPVTVTVRDVVGGPGSSPPATPVSP